MAALGRMPALRAVLGGPAAETPSRESAGARRAAGAGAGAVRPAGPAGAAGRAAVRAARGGVRGPAPRVRAVAGGPWPHPAPGWAPDTVHRRLRAGAGGPLPADRRDRLPGPG